MILKVEDLVHSYEIHYTRPPNGVKALLLLKKARLGTPMNIVPKRFSGNVCADSIESDCAGITLPDEYNDRVRSEPYRTRT